MQDTNKSHDFYTALAEGQLMGSVCSECGAQHIPHRRICPQCHGVQHETFQFSGEGTLVAFTVIRVPPTHMAQAGYHTKNPYCVGIVELTEGPRVAAQILDVNLDAPETINIGTPLKMTTITRGEGETQGTFLAFKPA
jgi:hypothetical protein